MDFYFRGIVKDNIFACKPHNLLALKIYISDAFQDIKTDNMVHQCVMEESIQHRGCALNVNATECRTRSPTPHPPSKVLAFYIAMQCVCVCNSTNAYPLLYEITKVDETSNSPFNKLQN